MISVILLLVFNIVNLLLVLKYIILNQSIFINNKILLYQTAVVNFLIFFVSFILISII